MQQKIFFIKSQNILLKVIDNVKTKCYTIYVNKNYGGIKKLNKQNELYKLYEEAKNNLLDIIEILRGDKIKIDADNDLYFTSWMIERLSIINKLYAQNLYDQQKDN